MGIISSLLGHQSEADVDKVEQQISTLLCEGERVQKAYKVIRDLFLFTTKRLILIDKQGITGRKREYVCIPYRSIAFFSIESAGHFDMDSELRIWVGSSPEPLIKKEFKKNAAVADISKLLAEATC